VSTKNKWTLPSKSLLSLNSGVPIRFHEAHSFVNNASSDLELMIVGISAQKNVLDTELGEMRHAH
jgi:hypothetical protein